MNKEKLGKNAIFLIASDLIYTITALFAQTFLVAYLLKITNDNITQVSLYYMIINFIHAMGSIFIGKFIKNGKYNKTKILSLGIIIRAIFILFIVLLGNKLSNMFVIVAIFCGISETLYWSAHEIIFVEITNNENRKSYMATKKIASTIVNIVAPIILGSTIELYSFTKIAIYVLALSIIQIVLSFQIKIDSKVNVKTTKFSLKNYINTIKTKKQQAETAQSPIPGNRTPPACLYLIYRYLIYCYFIYCNLIYRNLITVSHSIIICDLLYDFLLFTELFVDRILRTDFRHFGSDIVGLVLKISRSQPDAFCDLFHILFL